MSKRRPTASRTRIPSGTTSRPMPSPSITAIRYFDKLTRSPDLTGSVCLLLARVYRKAALAWRILLAFMRSGIQDLETAILPCGELQIICCVRTIGVRDEFLGNVMFWTAFLGIVQLPQIFESRCLYKNVPCRRRPTLLGSVVHDRHSWGN